VKKVRGIKEGAKWAEIALCHSVIAFCHETIAKAERRVRRLSSSDTGLSK
jgi:hypothetical protein